MAPCAVTLIVSCVICAAFRGLVLFVSVEQMNIAVGAAQCNVQYWCASCDEVLTCTQLATVQCVVGNVIVSYVLQSFKYTHTHVIVRRLHVGPPYLLACAYTGCPRRNGPNFGRVFLMLNYTDITQNTYIQS